MANIMELLQHQLLSCLRYTHTVISCVCAQQNILDMPPPIMRWNYNNGDTVEPPAFKFNENNGKLQIEIKNKIQSFKGHLNFLTFYTV